MKDMYKACLILVCLMTVLSPAFKAVPLIAQPPPPELTVGVLKNFPPEYSTDKKTGRPEGFAIDIMNAVAKRSGYRVRYRAFDTWPEVIEAVKKGILDVIPNFGVTEERRQYADFTRPTNTFHIHIFVRATTDNIITAGDLAGKKVAVVADNLGKTLMELHKNLELLVFDSPERALMELLSGNADALVYPEPVITRLADQAGLEGRIKVAGGSLREVKRAIAVRKGQSVLLHELDTALAELLASPEYKEIYRRWFGTPKPYWTVKKVMLLAAVALGIMACAFAVWRHYALRQINEKLMESQARFRAIAAHTPDHILMQDRDLRYTLVVNPQLGLTEREMLGKTDYDFLTREEADRLTAAKTRVMEKGEPLPFETSLVSLAGKREYFDGTYVPDRDPKGQVTGLIGYFRNVTAQKQMEESLRESEERLRLSTELADVAVWEYDFITNSMSRSKNHDRLYGLPWQEQWDIDTFLNATHPEDRTYVNETIRKSVAPGGPDNYAFDFRVVHPDQSIHWLAVVGQVVERDQKGEGMLVRGCLSDITERKVAEENLRKLNEELDSRVRGRTAELEKKLSEIGRLNRLFVDRELRMVELKEKIKELESRIFGKDIKTEDEDSGHG